MNVILNPEYYKENMLWSIGLSVLCNIKFNELARTAAQDPILVVLRIQFTVRRRLHLRLPHTPARYEMKGWWEEDGNRTRSYRTRYDDGGRCQINERDYQNGQFHLPNPTVHGRLLWCEHKQQASNPRLELLGRRQLCTIWTLHKTNGIKSSITTA